MDFMEKLAQAARKNKSLLCVGLDTDPSLIPGRLSVFEFNKAIIDATADLVCAYKPNIAFYEAMGIPGLEALQQTRDYIPQHIPVIIDAKRGDIGNTAKAYARSCFEHFGFDAVTVSPYLGLDSLQPFIDYKDKGVIILCRTSNPGAADFQSLRIDEKGSPKMLYEVIAEKVNTWNTFGNLGLVVGATYPQELKTIRERYPDMLLLIPGVGTQGGELSETVRFGADVKHERTIINSSRQILYASKGKDYAAAARKVAEDIKNKINQYL